MRAAWTMIAAALALAACRLGDPEPTPLTGPAPAVVAVWPFAVGGAGSVGAREPLLAGLDGALRSRGYRVVTAPVAAELLAAAGLGATSDPAAAGPALGADAVLVCEARSFTATGARPLQSAEWDLGWRLVSTRGGGELWRRDSRATWSRPRDDGRPPGEPLDALPQVVNVGANPVTYRDAAELCAWLHRSALLHLPVVER
ncbi:MAG: hypothetical protein FJ301_02655 [Planctomycetes bacterium]|nr:hypothetical protein [Planctomycetota bacterium]